MPAVETPSGLPDSLVWNQFADANKEHGAEAMRTHLRVVLGLVLLMGAISCDGDTKVFTQPSSAMEPTILSGEKFTADMKPFQPLRGDLVIIHHQGILIVKRVIAVGGDVIEGRDLNVLLNGKLLNEPYIEHIGMRLPLVTFGPITVPSGSIFVAGDNRDYSLDSRDPRFGLVSIADVKGKPLRS